MFRRRTDQVYSTLQQVQRRITEQTGSHQPPAGDEANDLGLVNLQPLSQALPLARGSTPFPETQIQTPLLAQQAKPQTSSFSRNAGAGNDGKRYVMQMSLDVAMLLVVAWIVCMVVMFLLGRLMATPRGAGLAAGDAGHRGEITDTSTSGAGAANRQGDYVLVLQAHKQDAEWENFLKGRAKMLNTYALANARSGWKPYFGVRKVVSGDVQLVFGDVDGHFGISKEGFYLLAQKLVTSQDQNGGGYTTATWENVGQ
jgi:hypothetical protein